MIIRKPSRKIGKGKEKIPQHISAALKASMDRRKNIKVTLAKSAKDFNYEDEKYIYPLKEQL